ncbi:MAG: GNAT family N-acetyltransferase [Chloroflexi bacterium]|nr:GNAT family N-acetyltransferase [Chloroflexota bacterium]
MKYEFLTRANAGTLHALCTANKPEFASANAKRERWWDEMFTKGLRGWIAFDDGAPVGFIEYLPIEVAPFPVAGENAHYITCLWVLPEYERQHAGRSLLAACLGDSPSGVATIAYEGTHKPASFFKHLGFRQVDQVGDSVLLVHGQATVELERAHYQAHENAQRLAVDVLFNPECPWSVRTAERVIAAVDNHPARAEIDLWVADAWASGAHLGLGGGVFFNGTTLFSAPPSDKEIQEAIENALTVRAASDL